MAFLAIKDLVFCQSNWRLEIDAHIEKNSCTAVIGRSGAGKSTLLSLIAGFETPESGDIVIDDKNVTQLVPASRPVTMLFQENNLFAHLTIWQNIGLGIHPGLKLSKNDKDQIDEAIATVGLEGLEERLPGKVSGGERQRAALARCICQNRPIWLLDEPFNSLDPALRQEMGGLVDQLRRDHQLTVLLVSHNPQEAAEISDNALFLENGRIFEHGKLEDLLEQPATPELNTYLTQPHK